MRLYPRTAFWKNVFTLTAGTAIAQLIPVLISPVLTRLYSPEDFGIFGLYFSCTMILSVVVCGRYDMAILLPEKDKDRVNLLVLCFFIATVVSIVVGGSVLIWKDALAKLFKNSSINSQLVWIPVSVFLVGIFQSLNFWANRNNQYKHLAVSRISRSFVASGLSIFFGFAKLKKSGLILADIFGQLLAFIYLLYKTWNSVRKLFSEVSVKGILAVAIRYKRFPKFSMASGLLEKAAGNAPILLLTIFFTSLEAGFFALAYRVISAPVSLVATAIGDVFRQEASVVYGSSGNCRNIFRATFIKLLLISVPGFVLGFILIKFLFTTVFGAEWETAGLYCQIMCGMFFLQFIFSPLSSMFIIAEKQHIDMLNNFLLFTLCLLAFWIAKHYFNNATVAIVLYSIVYILKYTAEFIFSYHFSKGTNHGSKQ